MSFAFRPRGLRAGLAALAAATLLTGAAWGQGGYPPPNYGPPAYGSPGGPPAPDLPPEEAKSTERSGAVAVVRAAFIPWGSGSADCKGCPTGGGDLDSESIFGLGLDVLGHAIPQLRLGAGAFVVPFTKVSDVRLGTDMSLQGIIEGFFDTGQTVSIALRVQGGLMVLVPGGDLKDTIEASKDACDTIRDAGGQCDVRQGPYLGPTVGGGLGFVFDVGGVGLRTDVLVQWHHLSTWKEDVTDASGANRHSELSLSMTRLWLALGVEF